MNRSRKVLFVSSIVTVLWYLNGFALRYLTDEIGVLGIYWPRRSWLQVHIGASILPLLVGPVLLWLGLERMSKPAYYIALSAYLAGAAISAATSLYLAFHTGFGLVVGLGFTSMGISWLVAIALTTVAAIRSLPEQFREWLTRSYVLTFGFVLYRVLCEIFSLWGHGTFVEQMSAACWLSWSVPMMMTEAFLQGRKLLTAVHKPVPKESWVSLAQLQDLN